MAWYRIAENVLDAIANAINAKTGKTAPMTPVDMVLEIESISGGGAQIVSGTKTFANRGVGATFTHNADVSDYIFILAVPPTDFEDLKTATSITFADAVLHVALCSSKFAYINQKTQGFDANITFKPSDNSYGAGVTNVNSAAQLYATFTNNSVTYSASFGFHPTTYKFWVIPITNLTV